MSDALATYFTQAEALKDIYDGVTVSGQVGDFGYRLDVRDYIKIQVGKGIMSDGQYWFYSNGLYAEGYVYQKGRCKPEKRKRSALFDTYFDQILVLAHMSTLKPE